MNRKKSIIGALLLVLVLASLSVAFPAGRNWFLRLFGLGHPGHRELTMNAAKKLGFTDAAAKIMAKGAVDADKRDWNTVAAHGQTANDELGRRVECPEQAQAELFNYLREKRAQIRQVISIGKYGEALYRMGYALHAIQDLASHQGITNAEHSSQGGTLGFKKTNPDLNEKNYQLAEKWTADFLGAMHASLGDDWEHMRNFSDAGPSENEQDLVAIAGVNSERTLGELWKYVQLGKRYEQLPDTEKKTSQWKEIENLGRSSIEAISGVDSIEGKWVIESAEGILAKGSFIGTEYCSGPQKLDT